MVKVPVESKFDRGIAALDDISVSPLFTVTMMDPGRVLTPLGPLNLILKLALLFATASKSPAVVLPGNCGH